MSQPPFDPDKAPMAKNTPADIGRMNAEFNQVVVKLGEVGVKLHGHFKWHILHGFWNPTGFDFHCEDWKRLHDVAAKSPRLGFDPSDMPGYDPWKAADVKFVGFTQAGKPPLVHLDIAISRPGLCRVYIAVKGYPQKIDALQRAKAITARDTDVYKEIYRRVRALGVDLDLHIGAHLTAGRSRLDGINFVAKDHEALKQALTDAVHPGGDKVFAPGSKSSMGHLPLSISYRATEGTGFRQIWRPNPTDRPIATPDPKKDPAMDAGFSSHFGDNRNLPDLTSVHCAVSDKICNIHIDEMGFVMTDAKGNVIVDPDVLRHLLIELLWKTNLQGKLPFWALDRVNFDIASSPLNFKPVGIGFDFVQTKRVKATIRGQCSVDGSMECSGTIGLGVNF